MQQFNDIKAMIATLQSEFTASVKLKQDFETQLSILKSSSDNQQQSTNQFDEIVHEVMERQKRKKNLIIFGIPEQQDTQNTTQKSEHDKLAVDGILKTIRPDFSLADIKIYRLSRLVPTNSKSRPIRIDLNDEADVSKFIHNAKALRRSQDYKKISIAYDRTLKQVESYKLVKQQLKCSNR